MVELLADRPSLVSDVAHWMWREWGEEEGGEPEERVRERVAARASRDAIPFTLVAFLGGEPVGCLSVCWDDIDLEFAGKGPWLSGMVVRGPARNLGVGRALVTAAERRTAALGYHELWLHTGEAQQFYERCGWTVMRPKTSLAQDAVMRKDL